MCDIISEFCDTCCNHISKNKNISKNADDNDVNIFFSNENTYDIIYNKITTIHTIYYNNKHIRVDTLMEELENKKFNVICKDRIKNILCIKKDNDEINLVNMKYLSCHDIPHKNILLNIETKSIIVNNNMIFDKMDNFNEYLTNNKKKCIEVLMINKEYIFDFMYIFLRWNCFSALEIVEYFKKMLNENRLKSKINLFFESNIKHVTNFLVSLKNVEESRINLFAKLMETKFHVLNEPFYFVKHVRSYGYNITTARQYIKFVCFSKLIKIGEFSMNCLMKKNKVEKPNIEIPSYNLENMKVINKNYSVLSKLEQIGNLMSSCKDVNDINFISSISDKSLKMSASIFYQICKIFFAVDNLGENIEALKCAYICKKCQNLLEDEFIENISILNSICVGLKLNNSIDDKSFIFKLNNNKTVSKYEILNNKKIPWIIKNKNNFYDMYDYQKFYYLLLEEVYLNNYEGMGFEESDNSIYEKIINTITERVVEEKTARINYLKTGCKKYDLFSTNNSCDSNSNSDSDSTKIDDKVDDDIYFSSSDDISNDMCFGLDLDTTKMDSMFNNYFNEFDDKNNLSQSNNTIHEYCKQFYGSDSDDDDDNDSIIINDDDDDEDDSVIIDDSVLSLNEIEDEVIKLKEENMMKMIELESVKMDIIKKLTNMRNFEIKLLEDVNIKNLSGEKINEILEYYEII